MTAARTASNQLPAAGSYRIDCQRSKVTYTGRHLFGMGTVHATFRIRSGEILLTDPPTGSTLTVFVDPASFDSGNAKRDKDVCGRSLLDAVTYPDITFRSEDLSGDGSQWTLSGTVSAHGTTVPVDAMLDQIAQEPDGVLVRARAHHLDRHAFGITGARGMVGRHLNLDFVVFAVPA